MKTRAQHRAARRASVVGRPSRRLLAVLLVVLVTAGTTWFSGASFTSSSFTWATVGAAADYHPPTVAVTSPGGTVSGTVTVQATASDSASGVASVRLEHAAVGSASWTTLCTDTTAPYSCPWSTTLVADGDYRLRALATDVAGFSATSAEVTTRVANPASVTLTTVPDIVRGTVPLSATITGAGNRSVSSAFQHRVDGATTWTTITGCSAVAGTAPSCSWATGTLADLYDVRVVSTVGTGASAQTVSAEQLDVVVDNLAPTVSITSPSGTMSGTVQVVAVPLDEDSGVERVELSYKLATASTYTPLCTVSTDPYRCALNTTSLTNLASYDLRAIAYDEAGNVSTAAVVRRQVNNGLATITITSPLTGDLVTGTRTITTDHSTPLGTSASSVRIEARLAGGSYATICTDTTAPYSCTWATASLASGTWELRATMTYGGALTVTSPVVTVTVDNNPLKALDVQAANGGVANIPGAGDTIVLTYQGVVDLTTVKAGWTGESTPLTVTFADKAVSPSTSGDRAGFSVPLGSVVFVQNYVKKNKSVAIPATMTAETSASGGVALTVITVTLGTSTSTDLRSSTTAGAMRWTPSASVRNTGGVACSTTPATESGASDRDL